MEKKSKYVFNPKSLNYDKIEFSTKERIFKFIFTDLAASIVIGIILFTVFLFVFDSPKERSLKRKNKELLANYESLDKKMDNVSKVLKNIQYRDDNIYRVIFEAEPISSTIRNAGFGGVNNYENLEGMDNSDIVIETTKRIDKIMKKVYIQSKSYDLVEELVKTREKRSACIPAIQPVSNENLKRMASGFGMRFHPILKYRKFHEGMDFTAPVGTKIYATGEGSVYKVGRVKGFGKRIKIKHGFGYTTVYGHMHKIYVKKDQKVKRGDVIGEVGNTGLSTGPHLHYEVRKNGKALDPADYYFNDLNPAQYQKMLELSSRGGNSLD